MRLERTRNEYAYNWSQPKTYKRAINPSDVPWCYQSWSDLDGYPMLAEIDTYYGGGLCGEFFVPILMEEITIS